MHLLVQVQHGVSRGDGRGTLLGPASSGSGAQFVQPLHRLIRSDPTLQHLPEPGLAARLPERRQPETFRQPGL
jgi:hypothetical protein